MRVGGISLDPGEAGGSGSLHSKGSRRGGRVRIPSLEGIPRVRIPSLDSIPARVVSCAAAHESRDRGAFVSALERDPIDAKHPKEHQQPGEAQLDVAAGFKARDDRLIKAGSLLKSNLCQAVMRAKIADRSSQNEPHVSKIVGFGRRRPGHGCIRPRGAASPRMSSATRSADRSGHPAGSDSIHPQAGSESIRSARIPICRRHA
jgi:hypothetical protein